VSHSLEKLIRDDGQSRFFSPQRPIQVASDDFLSTTSLSTTFHIHHRVHLVNMQLSEETKVR
jgi:hypothetical protein